MKYTEYKITTKQLDDMLNIIIKSEGISFSEYEALRDIVDDYDWGFELEVNTKENQKKIETLDSYYMSIVDTMERWIGATRLAL